MTFDDTDKFAEVIKKAKWLSFGGSATTLLQDGSVAFVLELRDEDKNIYAAALTEDMCLFILDKIDQSKKVINQ